MPLLLKPEYASTVMGFNNSCKPLGERDDLYLLCERAILKQHKAHLNMFSELPTQSEIDAYKEAVFNKKREIKMKRRQQ